MRCFIAIELNDAVRHILADLIRELATFKAPIKWVEPENLHLTVKFLGSIPDDQVSPLSEQLTCLSRSFQPFTFSVTGTGSFPNWERPRVLWVGATEEETFRRLHREVEDVTVAFGVDREGRPFHPHITLGRVRELRGLPPVIDALRRLQDRSFGFVIADHLTLFESRLSSSGPTYRIVSQHPFASRGGIASDRWDTVA